MLLNHPDKGKSEDVNVTWLSVGLHGEKNKN